MTEIFYRLLSEANGTLYQREKEERFIFVFEKLIQLISKEKDKKLKEAFILAREILEDYQEMNLVHTTLSPSETERRALAKKCLLVRKVIFKSVNNRLKGIRYDSISNERFSELKQSEITAYLFVALFLLECRGRLLEFLLQHRI
ncbi:MAG: hypothetical protein GQ574_05755 [Crocinitomix sp.]|nr:hypothetical protein [Crocinitomix sp.]